MNCQIFLHRITSPIDQLAAAGFPFPISTDIDASPSDLVKKSIRARLVKWVRVTPNCDLTQLLVEWDPGLASPPAP